MPQPPFRAEHVGSLLRPPALKQARADHLAGTIDDTKLRTVEDACITDAIAHQERVGLRGITDGEMRRAFWHYDFLEQIEGIHSYLGDRDGLGFKGVAAKPKRLEVTGKLRAPSEHPMVGHFRFVQARTSQVAKMTIPSPSALHFRFGRASIARDIYPDLDGFFADLAAAYRGIIAQLSAAGCRYLQLDEVYLAYLCDPAQRAALAERGEDPDALPQVYAGLINAAIAGIPPEMRLGMHLCRGNFRSSFVSSGGYEPVAELLFNEINVHAYFMEYDTDRAGGFEPLRFVPKGKTVVLGLVTSKSGTLEDKDTLRRRIEAAATFVPLEQLCLSPQCGFSSTEEGNVLTEAEQWRKLELVREVAEEVWGGS